MSELLILPTAKDDVLLRQITVDDAQSYFDAVNANREHLSQFGDTTAQKYPTLEYVVDSIQNPANPDKVRMAILDNNQFVGTINLTPEEDGAEIGYWIDARFTGRGYATLATRAISMYAAQRFPTVYAEVVDGNDKSVNVLERAGFRPTARHAGRLLFELMRDVLHSDIEIERQLDAAFAAPKVISLKGRPSISQEDILVREAYYARQAGLPDNIKIKSYEAQTQVYEVTTTESAQYPLLLAQAFRRLEIVKGLDDPGLVLTPELEKTAKHERTHGSMAAAFGYDCKYGVRVLNDPEENIWALSPFHGIKGDSAGTILLTRFEEAAILLAPEEPSAADVHSARSAGFSDREEMLRMLYERYPNIRSADQF